MKIAKAGRPVVGVWLLMAAAGALPFAGKAGRAVTAAGLSLAGFCAHFFRDPDRPAPSDPSKIYASGDGRVLSVAREGPAEITTVRIFLSIFDVHVQRSPCSGTVDLVHYQPGAFRAAMADEARLNERNVVRIASEDGRAPVVVEQIAGLIARRIECWVGVGDRLAAGQRYGLIHFGSQAAVHLPAGARALVQPGDRVIGGVTPIGEWTG